MQRVKDGGMPHVEKNPIIAADDPWGTNFDATMVWGPMHGAVYYIGIRMNFNKY